MKINNIRKEAEEYEGTINCGLSFTFCNYLILIIKKDFSQNWPSIHINIIQQGIECLEMEIALGACDFCIIGTPERKKEISFVEYKTAELYVCFSNKHPFAKYEEVDPKMLVQEKLLISGQNAGVTKLIFKKTAHAYV